MQAMVQHKYGNADVLAIEEIARPTVGDDEVLIRVQAASLNPFDWHEMTAKPFLMRFGTGLFKPKRSVLGVDVAGRVEAIGPTVTRFEPGDEVFGWCRGAYAQYARVRETQLLPRPMSLSPEQAAAVPIAGFTALQGLRDRGRIAEGDRVLIIGASGGVGTFAVQIAKAFGAEVTGVCSSRNADLVRSLGADYVVDYTQEDITKGQNRYDLIFQLAGTVSPAKLLRILTPTGTLVLSSGEGRLSGLDRIVKAYARAPFVSQRMVTWVANNSLDDLATLTELFESGKVTPVIDKSFDLSEGAAAMRYLEAGHTRGKVVITP